MMNVRSSHTILSNVCRNTFVLLFILFISKTVIAQDPYISGPDSVCVNDEFILKIENANPEVEYEWGMNAQYSQLLGFYPQNWNASLENMTTQWRFQIFRLTEPGIHEIEICFVEKGGDIFNPLGCKTFTFFPLEQDMLVFPSETCDLSVNTLPYDIRYIDRFFCLGDTTDIEIASYKDFSHETIPPTELFTPDRIEILNGQLLDYNDIGFTVLWDQVGRKKLRFKTINAAGCSTTLSADIIVKDTSKISVMWDGDETLNTCVGTEINITANVPVSTKVKWQVSDGRIYTSKTVDVSFETPGIYTIEVYEEGECTCSGTTLKTIIVEDGVSPSIECIGSTCVGEEVTYYSGDSCGQYLWEVSQEGTVIDGGGVDESYITVLWNISPQGTVKLTNPGCFENPCVESISSSIPIIGNDIEIEGKQSVCYGDLVEYTVPFIAGTEYTWNISSFYGTITRGQGTNSILIRWKNQTALNIPISLFYTNCFTNCSGSDSHLIEILPEIDVWYTEESHCINDYLVVIAKYDLTPDWVITYPNNTTQTISSSNRLEAVLDQSGVYNISVLTPPNTTCNDLYQFDIEVFPDPLPPNSITESTQICEGASIQYSVPGLGPFDIVQWVVFDGDLSQAAYSSKSKTLNYLWKSTGPYRISARIVNGNTGCVSEQTLFDLENNATILGNNVLCKGMVGTYSISTDTGQNIEWNISPVGAGEIVRTTSDSVYILWKTPGTHEVQSELCGGQKSLFVNVEPEINLFLDGGPTCPDDPFQLTSTSTNGLTIEVYKVDDELVGTNLPLALDSSGFYIVKAENSIGCTFEEEVDVQIFSTPDVHVSSPQNNVYCMTVPFDITLVVDTDGTYTFEWFKDGVSLGLSGTSITTNEFGSYHVVVTDSNGCTSESNKHMIRDNCITSGACNFSMVNIDCNNLVFEVIPPYNSTSFTWRFGDPDSGDENTAIGLTASHEFTHAGYFYVDVLGNANEGNREIVEIGTVANFTFENGCTSQPIQFENKSTYIPGFDDSNYMWTFGDPGSGLNNTSTDEDPTHTYISPGEYQVTLETTDINGCISSKTKTIKIFNDPEITILSRDRVCINRIVEFEPSIIDEKITYSWDFGDPNSGLNNTSLNPVESHIFSSIGFYTISLKIRNEVGCSYEVTKQIEIAENNLTGEISGSISLPKCPDENIRLSAPPAIDYHWSTGETTPFIDVVENGNYSVTITDDIGCSFTAPAFSVYSIDLYSTFIYGKKSGLLARDSKLYLDSITVCENEPFNLFSNEIPFSEYLWSTSETENALFYDDVFSDLTIGSYDYWLEVTDEDTGCSIRHDYNVRVIPKPNKQTILKSQPGNCEGNTYTLNVQNPASDLTYIWQDGTESTSFETNLAGTYYVDAINSNGCVERSDSIIIHPIPTRVGWMTGCLEVCFPHEFCLNLNEEYNYALHRDGAFVYDIDPSASDFTVSGPGDYTVIAIGEGGCSIETDYLSLDAIEDDQEITGIVFYDENQNGIFDGNDVLLEGATVYLMAGSTILETFITDATGSYIFTSFEGANHHIQIDVSSLEYDFEGVTDSVFVFDNCIDTEELDFPLTTNCFIQSTRIDQEVCPGAFITIEGIDYFAGDQDTLRYPVSTNCDSSVYINVIETLEPVISLDVFSSCSSASSGEVSGTIIQGTDLRFSIDNSTDTVSILAFDELSVGDHTIYIHNRIGCSYPYPFEVAELDGPELSLSTQQSCSNAASGELNIQIISGLGLSFSIDGITYSPDQNFNAIDTGEYTLMIVDDQGCEYTLPFEIEGYPEPEFSILEQNACEGQSNGSIEIQVQNGDNLQYSLDGSTNWTITPSIGSLDPGNYTLYTLTENGCILESPFEIESTPEPMVELSVTEACENLVGGVVEISSSTNGLQVSLDGVNYSSDSQINDLPSGDYTLFYQTQEGCVYETPFSINEINEPVITISPTPTCLQNDNGTISISIVSGTNLEFSLDEISFSSELEFENLYAGSDTLYVMNEEECIYPIPFDVPNLPAPEIGFETMATCMGESEGVVDLTILVGNDLQFSLDGSDYSEDLQYTNLSSGDYSLFVIDQLGCDYEFSLSIDPFEQPEFDLKVNEACTQDETGSISISLLNSVGIEFSIDDKNNWVDDNEISFIEIGDHTLYTRSEHGCIDSLPFSMQAILLPELQILSIPQCEDNNLGSFEIITTDSELEFSIDGISFSGATSFTDITEGEYTLYYRTSEGCILEQPFEIESLPSPEIEITTKPTCEGENSGNIIVDNLDGQDLSYSIDGEAYNLENEFSGLTYGDYTIYIQNEANCIYEFDIAIGEETLPTIEIDVIGSCQNMNDGILDISTDAGETIYLDGIKQEDGIVDRLPPGQYTIGLESVNGCRSEEFVEISSLPPLDIVAPVFELDCYETEVVISPEVVSSAGDATYLWNDGTTSSSLTAITSGFYSVTISDDCTTEEYSWDLGISAQLTENLFYSPNIFSPNDDGVNDCFKIVPRSGITIESLNIQVLDRWGNLVFNSNDQANCWDGTFNNEKVSPGVFVYIVDMSILQCDELVTSRIIRDLTVLR